MDKPILINSDEILLVVYDDDQNIGRSGPLDESQVLKIIDEANIEHLHEESKVHDFVLESDAYQELLDEIADEKYNDEIYGTYEQQHRLRPCDVL
ncbi:hypothetical protein [Bartonella sp. CM87QHHN]|uniref:hypothetical protein n=1 Tax=Bartonella sp. CM87QHHN TaxID=3243546 RepID=UPI0035CED2EF